MRSGLRVVVAAFKVTSGYSSTLALSDTYLLRHTIPQMNKRAAQKQLGGVSFRVAPKRELQPHTHGQVSHSLFLLVESVIAVKLLPRGADYTRAAPVPRFGKASPRRSEYAGNRRGSVCTRTSTCAYLNMINDLRDLRPTSPCVVLRTYIHAE